MVRIEEEGSERQEEIVALTLISSRAADYSGAKDGAPSPVGP
jgi:hypothetical protein